MDTSVALTIIGSVMILLGLVKNLIPKKFNQIVMGDLHEAAVNPSAAMRIVIGGAFIAVGIIAVYCRNLPNNSAVILLTGLQIGLAVILVTIISGKLRGFMDDIPIPPLFIFSGLIAIGYFAS